MLDLEQLRFSVSDIRKSGQLSHWRIAYADFLLNRASEYIAVNREPEANMVMQKLERWINVHTKKITGKCKFIEHPLIIWNKQMLLQIAETINTTLQKKRSLLPGPERETMLRKLSQIKKLIDSDLLHSREELFLLRVNLIARLRRSLRAQLVSINVYHGAPAGAFVGLYNSQSTLEETVHVIGERDPIWVEDFLEQYNDLFRLVNLLSPTEKR